uniref:G-protein coupled receptors family 1 profile domain-containing protein n=1 Tax=Micrurus lemniscatus lemniscatus TaxID=129467 RepID=A0A2D4I977_MICLE
MYILLQPLIFFMASSVMILRVERSRKATFILICATCSPRYGAINSITAFISDSQCLVGQIWLCKRNSKRLIWTLWTLSHLIFGLHPWILIYEFSFVLLLSNSLMRVLSCYVGNRNRQKQNKMKRGRETHKANGHSCYRSYSF